MVKLVNSDLTSLAVLAANITGRANRMPAEIYASGSTGTTATFSAQIGPAVPLHGAGIVGAFDKLRRELRCPGLRSEIAVHIQLAVHRRDGSLRLGRPSNDRHPMDSCTCWHR